MASIYETGIAQSYIIGIGNTLGQATSHNDYEHILIRSYMYQMLTRSRNMREYRSILKYALQLCADNATLKPHLNAVLDQYRDALAAHMGEFAPAPGEQQESFLSEDEIFALFTPVYLRYGGNCRITTRVYPLYPSNETIYAAGGESDYDTHFLYQYAYASKKNQQWKCKTPFVMCDAYSMVKLGCNPLLDFGVVVYFYNRIIHVAKFSVPIKPGTSIAVIAKFKPISSALLIDVCITERECAIATRDSVYVFNFQTHTLIQHFVEHEHTAFLVESIHIDSDYLRIGTTLGQLYTIALGDLATSIQVVPFGTPILKICPSSTGGRVMVQTIFEAFIFMETGAQHVVYRNRLVDISLEPTYFTLFHFNGAIEIISFTNGAKYIIPYTNKKVKDSTTTTTRPWYSGLQTIRGAKLVAIYPNMDDIRVISVESIVKK